MLPNAKTPNDILYNTRIRREPSQRGSALSSHICSPDLQILLSSNSAGPYSCSLTPACISPPNTQATRPQQYHGISSSSSYSLQSLHTHLVSNILSTTPKLLFLDPPFVLTLPTVPCISPNPIAPLLGVASKSQLPSAVVANVCVKGLYTTDVTPLTVKIEGIVLTVASCVATIVGAAAAPPPPATWEETRGVRRARGVSSVVRRIVEWRVVGLGKVFRGVLAPVASWLVRSENFRSLDWFTGYCVEVCKL